MSKFDSREDYEAWKAAQALRRYGRGELERSDREWAKCGPQEAGNVSSRRWLVLLTAAAALLGGVLYLWGRW